MLPFGNCVSLVLERSEIHSSANTSCSKVWTEARRLRVLIESSTCSYNVAKVVYIWFFTVLYIYNSFIMLLLFAMIYICYCTFSVFIVYWILDFTSFDMSWIFLYSIIFNVSLSYHVYFVLRCLETVFSLTREHSQW